MFACYDTLYILSGWCGAYILGTGVYPKDAPTFGIPYIATKMLYYIRIYVCVCVRIRILLQICCIILKSTCVCVCTYLACVMFIVSVVRSMSCLVQVICFILFRCEFPHEQRRQSFWCDCAMRNREGFSKCGNRP